VKFSARLGLVKKDAPAPAPKAEAPVAVVRPPSPEKAQLDLKLRIHRELIDRLDLGALAKLDIEQANIELRAIIGQLIDEQPVPMTQRDRERMGEEVLNEVYGLGPIEPLLRDHTISDILINGPRQVYIERFGKLEATPIVFRNDAHLLQIIDRIVSKVGRRVDESSPMVDARLPDGSRVNAIIGPLALDGPSVSIRRFGGKPLLVDDLIRVGAMTPPIAGVIKAMVRARLNMLISGGTGSGKTTMLNCLSSFIPETERIVTIEDSAELQLQQPHVVRLETRPPNVEGKGEITQRDLVRNSLRMRPDRVVIGEVRGAEALDMLQAMNTGHDGSIATLHANSARDALSRLETMIQMAGLNLGNKAMRQQISSALNVIVQTSRLSDGTRKLIGLTEVTGMEGETITLQDLFIYEREGYNEDGKIKGRFRWTGIRPRFADQLKASGHEFDMKAFDNLDE